MNPPIDTTGAQVAPSRDAEQYVKQLFKRDPSKALDWISGRAFAAGEHDVAMLLTHLGKVRAGKP